VVTPIFFPHAKRFLWNTIACVKKTLACKAGLVFKLVLISIFLPSIGALINFNIYHLPIFIGSFTILLMYAIHSNLRPLRILGILEISTFILFALLIIQILTNKGFGILSAGGYVVLMIIIFLGILNNQAPNAETIIRWISLLFQLLLIGIGIELIFILTGRQSVLTGLFYSEVTTHYKNYNPADFMRFIGLASDSGGPNSILLGSQIAGMVCLFSTLWFFFIRYLPNYCQNRKVIHFWLGVSIIFLLATMNGTAGLLTLLGFLIPYFLSKSKMQKINAFIFILLFLTTLVFLISQGYIFERIFSSEPASFSRETLDIFKRSGLEIETKDISVIDFYLFIFFRPVDIWLNSDIFSQIFGSGNELFLNEDLYIGGDFGFGSEVLLKSGLLWAFTFTWVVLSICFSALFLPYKCQMVGNVWVGLSKINALIGFLWFTSLIHYTPAIQNAGGYSLFALSLALVIYCKYRALNFSSK
jgi:hypothetical protein